MDACKPLRPGNRRGAATAVALLARNGAGRRRTAPAWFAPTRSGRSCQADSAAPFSIKGGARLIAHDHGPVAYLPFCHQAVFDVRVLACKRLGCRAFAL